MNFIRFSRPENRSVFGPVIFLWCLFAAPFFATTPLECWLERVTPCVLENQDEIAQSERNGFVKCTKITPRFVGTLFFGVLCEQKISWFRIFVNLLKF